MPVVNSFFVSYLSFLIICLVGVCFFLQLLGSISEAFWLHFWSFLAPFWMLFGSKMASFWGSQLRSVLGGPISSSRQDFRSHFGVILASISGYFSKLFFVQEKLDFRSHFVSLLASILGHFLQHFQGVFLKPVLEAK